MFFRKKRLYFSFSFFDQVKRNPTKFNSLKKETVEGRKETISFACTVKTVGIGCRLTYLLKRATLSSLGYFIFATGARIYRNAEVEGYT